MVIFLNMFKYKQRTVFALDTQLQYNEKHFNKMYIFLLNLILKLFLQYYKVTYIDHNVSTGKVFFLHSADNPLGHSCKHV